MANQQKVKSNRQEELQGDYITDADELTTPTIVDDSPAQWWSRADTKR